MSKHHSFSPGPRPLHLALTTPDSPGSAISPYSTPSPSSDSPNSTSVPSSATRFVRPPGAPRRQSSISYYTPKDSESRNATARTQARHGLTRSVSVGAKPPFSPGVGGDRRSTGSVESNQSERVTTPYTLAEK
jgi:hypothetical protein